MNHHNKLFIAVLFPAFCIISNAVMTIYVQETTHDFLIEASNFTKFATEPILLT